MCTDALNTHILIKAFLKGLQFDGVIIGYVNFLPILAVFLINYLQKNIILNIIFVYYSISYTIIYLLLFADIPYFNFFYSHITNAIFHWIDTPFMMIKQILSESYFVSFLVVFIIFTFLYILLIKKIIFNVKINIRLSTIKNLIFFIIFLGLNFLISRGRISAPLKEGDACISSSSYINQLALNGAFTFFKSFYYNINFYDIDYAFNSVKKILNVKSPGRHIERWICFKDTCKKYNIVLIIMEGMTLYNTSFKNNNLTYELDTIAKNGITFTNIWSSGKHTSSGIYSVLYSYPTIWSRRPTNSFEKTKYCGLPGTLKQLGYYNVFMTTQSLSFDNLQEFLPQNHFDTIIGIEHYKKEEIISMYGVPDHVMFDYGLKFINNYINNHNKPLFLCFLTTSNHTPYVVPENIEFVAKNNNISKKIIEYSSWAIGKFIKQCYNYEWFKNTLFVLISDHGFMVKPDSAFVPLCLHNIPLIFYNPFILKTTFISNNLGMQTDVYPMIMNILKCDYLNNTFGIDLFTNKRRFVYYSEDNTLICQNDSFQVIINKFGKSKIKKLKNFEITENNILKIKDIMTEYTLTQIQVANFLINNRQTNCSE
ncbi:MAG: LTA synthase family protein [Bacteroidales bacterium]|nr:LTA synthase family protein [Bacteroidales bacterium]